MIVGAFPVRDEVPIVLDVEHGSHRDKANEQGTKGTGFRRGHRFDIARRREVDVRNRCQGDVQQLGHRIRRSQRRNEDRVAVGAGPPITPPGGGPVITDDLGLSTEDPWRRRVPCLQRSVGLPLP
jgi:hypothetical protein